MGLSLWLVPDNEEGQKLKRIMSAHNQNPNLSKTSYPTFHPHITLASLPLSSEADLDKIQESILKLESPPLCIFDSVDIGSHYFRSVYVAVKATPELIDLHKRVHQAVNIEPRTPAFPHMSLCYVDDLDAANGERERYYEQLRESGNLEVDHQGNIFLNCGISSDVKDLINQFSASEIWVVECESPVEEWKVVRKLSFM